MSFNWIIYFILYHSLRSTYMITTTAGQTRSAQKDMPLAGYGMQQRKVMHRTRSDVPRPHEGRCNQQAYQQARPIDRPGATLVRHFRIPHKELVRVTPNSHESTPMNLVVLRSRAVHCPRLDVHASRPVHFTVPLAQYIHTNCIR